MRRTAVLVLALAACRDRKPAAPPPPAVEHPAAIHGRVFALAAIDDQRAAIAHAVGSEPLRVSLWAHGAIAWSFVAPCSRYDLERTGEIGQPFIAITAAADLVTVSCHEGKLLRTSAFRVADGTRAWIGEPRDARGGIRAWRLGTAVAVYDTTKLAVLDAATGAVRATVDGLQDIARPHVWTSPPRVAANTWDDKTFHEERIVDTDAGTVRALPGVLHCALPDGLILVHENDYMRVGLDGSTAPVAADSVVTGDAACSTRGDRIIVATDLREGVRITEIGPDGRRGRSALVPHAGAYEGLPGWDRPLPRFLPYATHGTEIVVVDLDAMAVVRTLELRNVGGPGIEQLLAGRRGDTFVGYRGGTVWGVDGNSGEVVALAEPIADPYWIDFDTETRGPAWLVARDTPAGLVLSAAVLTRDASVAKQIVGARD